MRLRHGFAALALLTALATPAHGQTTPTHVSYSAIPAQAAGAAAFVQAVNTYAYASAPKQQAPAPRAQRTRASAAHSASGDRRACILARENGGDYGRSSNPSHFGAYQFDRQTWAANGGNPATWGSASPAEQDQVFNNTVAAHGYSPWAPYDGC